MNKTMFKITACALFALACGINRASAQSSATATATATIVTPITISKTTDMNFGNVAVQASNPGTVVMTPAGVRSATAGVTLPATSGTVSNASFAIAGQSGYTYAITLPSSTTITDGTNNMTVDAFTSNPSGTGTLTGGSQTLNIGATLHVLGGQVPGVYANTGSPFTVTVNYN